MQKIFNPNAPKKSANLSINSDLLNKARECEINLSSVLEQALVEQVKKSKRSRWREENRGAIAAYNELVHSEGVFSDDVRSF